MLSDHCSTHKFLNHSAISEDIRIQDHFELNDHKNMDSYRGVVKEMFRGTIKNVNTCVRED